MKLIIKPIDFEHIKEKSTYNHNYYKSKKDVANYATEILEICHEDYNFYEFHLIENNNKIFLGCSGSGISDFNKEIEIDFRLFYT